jgi:hypothetical protein
MTGRAHRRPRGGGLDRGAFYRLCRMLHAYLSAFAFLALMFFAVTGITLNHPEWFPTSGGDIPPATVRLPPESIRAALAAKDPPRALAQAVEENAKVAGAYHSGDLIDQDALLRWEGVRGSTEAEVDLSTGDARITGERAPTFTLLGDLHKGKNSGAPWKWVIDIAAAVIAALSIVGYVLFFSLRFRLRTSLILTAASLVVLVGAYALLVPQRYF